MGEVGSAAQDLMLRLMPAIVRVLHDLASFHAPDVICIKRLCLSSGPHGGQVCCTAHLPAAKAQASRETCSRTYEEQDP